MCARPRNICPASVVFKSRAYARGVRGVCERWKLARPLRDFRGRPAVGGAATKRCAFRSSPFESWLCCWRDRERRSFAKSCTAGFGTLTHLWIGNHIVFSTFDPATGKQTQIHSIDDPEWFLMNWTLSSDGHTLALAKKHRAPLAADILLLDLQGGKQRTLLLGNWFSIGCLDFAARWQKHLGERGFS
jgi:hypothetical protein